MRLTDISESSSTCPECGGPAFSDLMISEKQDACYHKVKSRYKVWPSAYASGALVQCRKKGAANWGNKSESVNESVEIQDTYKGWKFEVETQKEDDRNVTFYSAVSPEGKDHMLPKRATKEQFRQFVDSKTVKEGLGDEVNPADRGEYDREGDMAINQLKTIEDAATELRSILDAEDNLPEWVQSKITKAVDYIDTARDYMKSKEQGVAEAGPYGSRNPDLMSPNEYDRYQQDQMDHSKKAFKRAEHQAEWEREQQYTKQLQAQERGPWYLRIDGKVYRQKGQPKMFDHKKGANNYALAMIKNNPGLQGKIMLTKNTQDQ